MLRQHAKPQRDGGFTMIELMMTIAILAIIAVPLTGVVIEYLQTSVTTQTRSTENADQQFAATYWQADIASLGVRGYTPTNTSDQLPHQQSMWTGSAPAGVPASCASISGTVIGMAWNEYPSTTDPFVTWTGAQQSSVVYSATQQTSGQWILTRTRCVPGQAASSVVIARSLVSVPTVSCTPAPCTSSTPPTTVKLTLKVQDLNGTANTGYTSVLTGERRSG